jgi:hypothetical protein
VISADKRLHDLLCTVGLLRGRLSSILKTISDLSEHQRGGGRRPPEKLIVLLRQAQDQMTSLLKVSQILVICRENVQSTPASEQVFCVYLEDWAISRTGETLNSVKNFFAELAAFSLDGVCFDPAVARDGIGMINALFDKYELV